MNDIEDKRPDPDSLLDQIQKEEKKKTEGTLKIFFGMCAGVGKTYAMLQAAHKAKSDRVDVVVGLVETHKRIETQKLVDGLEIIPPKNVEYRYSTFKEMDIDAILKRKPSLVLVDELAHTNIPGSRHAKRFHDVLELLGNGIDVYTTLNVQHIESRSETIKQITGTAIRETVPDSVFERADEIELVDLTPDELLQRLREGKVYTHEKSKQAIENFFRKGNLNALREMALRITAERVDKELQNYRSEKNIDETWKSSQRLMVAISSNPHSSELIRWTRRLAYSMEIPWFVVYIETGIKLNETNRIQLEKNINLAKELGAEIIITGEADIVEGIIRIAREKNVTQILIGKTKKNHFAFWINQNKIIQRLIKNSGDIDVYVIGSERKQSRKILDYFNFYSQSPLIRYFLSSFIIILIGIFLFSVQDKIGYQTVSLIFLFVISVLPLFNFGPGPIFLAAISSAFIWNYFFIPPHFTLHIDKVEDALMFGLYFIIASVSGFLISRIRTQQIMIDQKEKKTSALYNLARELSSAKSLDDVTDGAIKQLKETFNAEVVFILSEDKNKLKAVPHSSSTYNIDDLEWSIAQWVFNNSQKAGRFTNTLANTPTTYFPLSTKTEKLGVIGLKFPDKIYFTFDLESLLNTFISQISIAVEREYLKELSKINLVLHESEKLYKTLFDSISHELKTPLTTIIGAVSSFKDEKIKQNPNVLSRLLDEINIASGRLNRLVENLLDITRLETGNLKPKLEWHSVSDLISSAIDRIKTESAEHDIYYENNDEGQILRFDFTLLEQAIVNILLNAINYTHAGSRIIISTKSNDHSFSLIISDNGNGFPEEAIPNLFRKFYRIPGTKAGGTGLGLSIARGFIEAHKGTITAQNKKEGGAEFIILLPTD
jgi:two-component system, OmpR family, sensor histidine kinase KdpD